MNQSKNEVITTRALKSFDELSLKVLAGGTSDNQDVALQFLALSPQAKFSAATTPLEQRMERRFDPLAETHEWYHGGINE